VNSFAPYLRRIINCYAISNHQFCGLGLIPGASGLCYVSPDYETAATFDIWGELGIDHHFSRNFREKLHFRRCDFYVVLHFGIPRAFIEEHGIYRKEPSTWLPRLTIPVLADKKIYDAFSGSDAEYYAYSECKFACILPASFVTGVSFPYV